MRSLWVLLRKLLSRRLSGSVVHKPKDASPTAYAPLAQVDYGGPGSHFHLMGLPSELIMAILDFVPPAELLSVVLACRLLRDLGTPLLYHDIHLRHPHRALHLLRTLTTHPELAEYIRTYARDDVDSTCRGSKAYAAALGTTVSDMQAKALERAVNLSSLEMRMGPASTEFPQALERVKFLVDRTILLRKLAIHSPPEHLTTNRLWARFLISILREQPLIEELHLPYLCTDGDPELALTLRDLPKLRKLQASKPESFREVLPRRRGITSLAFYETPLETIERDIVPLVSYPEEIVEVEWDFADPFSATTLGVLVTPFPALKTLRLRYVSMTHFPREEFWAEAVLLCLKKAPATLTQPDISGSVPHVLGQIPFFDDWSDKTFEVGSEEEPTGEDRELSALKCYEHHCPSLRFVVFNQSRSWSRKMAGDPWHRRDEEVPFQFERDVVMGVTHVCH